MKTLSHRKIKWCTLIQYTYHTHTHPKTLYFHGRTYHNKLLRANLEIYLSINCKDLKGKECILIYSPTWWLTCLTHERKSGNWLIDLVRIENGLLAQIPWSLHPLPDPVSTQLFQPLFNFVMCLFIYPEDVGRAPSTHLWVQETE